MVTQSNHVSFVISVRSLLMSSAAQRPPLPSSSLGTLSLLNRVCTYKCLRSTYALLLTVLWLLIFFFSLSRTLEVLVSLNEGQSFMSSSLTITASECVSKWLTSFNVKS